MPDIRCQCIRCGRLVGLGLSKPLIPSVENISKCVTRYGVVDLSTSDAASPFPVWIGSGCPRQRHTWDWIDNLADDHSLRATLLPATIRCREASFAFLTPSLGEGDRESEVLGKINVYDGDAFHAGECPRSNPPMPKIDREARRRAWAMKRTFTHFAPRIAPAKNLESIACKRV